MFLSWGPSDEAFIKPIITECTTILGIQSAYITCCYVGQAPGKFSGCEEHPVFKKYALYSNMLLKV